LVSFRRSSLRTRKQRRISPCVSFFWLIVLPVVAILVLQSCLYTVDRTEFVYLTQFGPAHPHVSTGRQGRRRPVCTSNGPWPVQSVQRLDRRLQYFDLPGAELMTRDRDRRTIDKTLTVDAYVCWRIADGEHVDTFRPRDRQPARERRTF